jgi:hypothetical protein
VGRLVWARWDGRVVRIFNDRLQQIAIHARHEAGRFSGVKFGALPQGDESIDESWGELMGLEQVTLSPLTSANLQKPCKNPPSLVAVACRSPRRKGIKIRDGQIAQLGMPEWLDSCVDLQFTLESKRLSRGLALGPCRFINGPTPDPVPDVPIPVFPFELADLDHDRPPNTSGKPMATSG